MHRLYLQLRRSAGGAALGLVVAMTMLVCRQASAQIVISNASVSTLQSALVSGVTNITLAFSGTLSPVGGPLEIVEDTTINATGYSVVIGQTNCQAFYVDPGVTFTLINVTLSGASNNAAAGSAGANGANGSGNGNGSAGNPGGAGTDALGGAVYNAGNSIFVNCLFLTNGAVGGAGGAGGNGGNAGNTNGLNHGGNGGNGGGGGGGYGGAIYNVGTLVLSNCSVAGNAVLGGAGGAGGTNGGGTFATSFPGTGAAGGIGSGAGIYNLGMVTFINSTVNQNTGVAGPASQSGGGTPNTQNGNGAAGVTGAYSEGGGVCNLGTNYFLNCTFFSNSVTGGLGGVGGAGNTSSFSGNGGTGGNGGSAYGGGIFNGAGSKVAVTNCTFSGDIVVGGTNGVGGTGNATGANGSLGVPYGANIANVNSAGTFLLKNSILDFPTNTYSAYGTITDQGNNISSDATPTFTTTNSFNSKDPKLSPSGPQANNSVGPLTIALSANSPAINAIYDGSAPAYDERNFPRPAQIRPDVGAFEFGAYSTNYNVTGTVTAGGIPFPGVSVSSGAISTLTDSNGNFSLSLVANQLVNVRPNPQAYFVPQSTNVTVVGNVSGLLFKASNAVATITNLTNGTGTNTNMFNLTFTGVPSSTYVVQAATNLMSPIVWTNLATNLSSAGGLITFSYTNTGTNFTNYPKRFFRAVP